MHPKTLFILRHAKALPAEEGQSDAERGLAERGCEDATRLGSWLESEAERIDHVYASSSTRTRKTYSALATHMAVSVSFDDGLYLASYKELLHTLQHLPETQQAVMLIGHNPGLHQLACALASRKNLAKMQTLTGSFPTCALVKLALPIGNWQEVQPDTAEICYFWTRHHVEYPA